MCWELCMCGFLFCSFCNEGALMELSSEWVTRTFLF